MTAKRSRLGLLIIGLHEDCLAGSSHTLQDKIEWPDDTSQRRNSRRQVYGRLEVITLQTHFHSQNRYYSDRTIAAGRGAGSMIVEDYSPDYFEARMGGNTPPVCEGKFVHITGPKEEYLVLSPVELTEYHAHIVQRFSRRRPEMSSVSLPSGEEVRFGTPGWSIKGGGRFQWDKAARRMALWGASKAYGKFDGAYIREALRQSDGWDDVSIQIGEPL